MKRFLLCAMLAGCAHHPLPSHPAADLFPQAISPPHECPGQYPLYVEDWQGNSWFLKCYGHKVDL